MIMSRLIAVAAVALTLGACATPVAQVDESRSARPVIDAKSQLESGRQAVR